MKTRKEGRKMITKERLVEIDNESKTVLEIATKSTIYADKLLIPYLKNTRDLLAYVRELETLAERGERMRWIPLKHDSLPQDMQLCDIWLPLHDKHRAGRCRFYATRNYFVSAYNTYRQSEVSYWRPAENDRPEGNIHE